MKEEKENLIEKIEKYCKKLKGWLYNIFPTRQHIFHLDTGIGSAWHAYNKF
jgi:hypothetical protein